ncbi:hypothetical protein K438DRAFT_1876187 [Mycena galopus ATCC 62051]|nr:hypothetical protein K438DRAFT_1876187 [Mycena galopus ATCC 62051]
MLAILASPTLFAIAAMFCFYASIIALAYQNFDTNDGEAVGILARIGTTGGAALMVVIFAVSAWLVWDLDTDKDNQSAVGTKLIPRASLGLMSTD